MSDRKKSGLKKSKDNPIHRDVNFELGLKTTFILMMYVLIDCELINRDNFNFVKDRFIKHLEEYKEGRLKLGDMIDVLKNDYGYTKVDF